MTENKFELKEDVFDLKEEVSRAPESPGVYIFRAANDLVIYVGKAINLRNRLRSYYQGIKFDPKNPATWHESGKIAGIQALSKSLEYIVTDTELEALILECNLIKEYLPRYNVRLKDDKSYPYICLSVSEDFPRVFMARKAEKDGNKYFGPFMSNFHVTEVVEMANTFWPLRRCAGNISKTTRPCLNYHIGQCKAPCGGHVSLEEYGGYVAEIRELLSGRHAAVIKSLTQKMEEAADRMEYEKAAVYRDKIISVKKLDEKQSAQSISTGDHDTVALARGSDSCLVQVFFIREGKMTGREHYMMSGVDKDSDGHIMQAFLTQFYSGVSQIPKELNLEVLPIDFEITEEWFKKISGRKTVLQVPNRGDKKRLLGLAKKNAGITLLKFGDKIQRDRERQVSAAAEIAGFLGIDAPLARIEAFDISNVSGYESVASMTVFEDGRPKRSDYRKFRLRTLTGANDYAAMEEAIGRRFNRYIKEMQEGLAVEDGKFSRIPDLLMVDGGKGQVSAAKRVLEGLNIEIPVCGMVKDDRHRTRGLIFEGREINPPKSSEGFKLINRIQDETHRFAVEYHRKLREKNMLRSVLDDIEGIGPKRRKALLRFFGSIEGIEGADAETLMKADGINKKAAEAVYNFFRRKIEL